MDWREFLETAERLARGATEGDWRSAVSRAYYAIFHFFREFLLHHGLDLGQGGQCHSNLYYGLNNCGVTAVQSLAARVDRLRQFRVEADYDFQRIVDQAQAQNEIQVANDLLNDFQVLLKAVPVAQIAAGARRYLQSIGRIP
jgi:uncharacterized protein (UPF0332 family)